MKTFKESYNKIVDAYLKDQLEPCSPCACFVGNLLNGKKEWIQVRGLSFDILKNKSEYVEEGRNCILQEGAGFYTPEDIIDMEYLFMTSIYGKDLQRCQDDFEKDEWEETIYQAMEKTLLKLREIHTSKGEIIEDYTFTKRNLELV